MATADLGWGRNTTPIPERGDRHPGDTGKAMRACMTPVRRKAVNRLPRLDRASDSPD